MLRAILLVLMVGSPIPRLLSGVRSHFPCPLLGNSFVADSRIGAIGPGRLFSPGQIYSNLLWFLLVGPVVIIITYLLGRRWSLVNYLSWPVAFGAMSLVPPATGVSFSSWWVINVIFNGLLRHRKPAWWSKYSMPLPLIVLAWGFVNLLQIMFCQPRWTAASPCRL